MQFRISRPWFEYLAAVGAVGVATMAAALLTRPVPTGLLFVIFFAAVTLATLNGGLRTGLLATALSYLVVNLWFVSARSAFTVNPGIIAFLVVSVVTAISGEALLRARRRAKASAEEIASIMESITDGFVAIDNHWQFTYMNRAAKELFRQHQRDAGHDQWDLFALTLGGIAETKLKQAAADRVTVEFENFYEPWKRWFDVKASPGSAGGLAIYFRDITERKLTQMALAESEERLRLAQQGAKAGLWDWDLVSGQITWSDEYCGIYGLNRADTPSHELFLKSVHPDDRDEVDRAISAAVCNRTRLDIQHRTIHPEKGLRWIAGLGRTSIDAAGRPLRMTGIALDITDRKRAEETLRFLSETGTVLSTLVDFESTVQNVAHLAMPFFADGCVVDVLNSFGEIERAAYAHRDLVKLPILKDLAHFPMDADAAALWLRVLRSRTPGLIGETSDEFVASLAADDNGRQLWRELNLRSLIVMPMLVREQTIGTISFMITGSTRRYTAADLELAAELAHRAAVAIDNARLYRDLKEAQRQKDDFLAMLSHELRNPLAAILYANEVAKVTRSTEDPTAEVIERQVKTLTRLIDDLLDVSRITRDKIRLKLEFIDAREVVRRALTTAQPFIERRGHRLVVDIADDPLPLHADPTRVEQILVNLLTNAAKYTPEGGTITVRAYPLEDQAIFRVSDTGIGIAAPMLPRVFELFTQGEQSLDRSKGGLGIGLTVVRRLVEMHGGRVSARSEGVDRGSEFIVGLPLCIETVEIPHHESITTVATAALRVLVVDDNVDTAQNISDLLKLKGHVAAMAHDGHAALELAHSFVPDVVLLDLGLPGLDGFHVAEALRSDAELHDVRLIALSGYGQPEDRKRTTEAGFQHHLVKPVEFHTLLSILSGAT